MGVNVKLDLKWDWGRAALTVVVLSMAVAIAALWFQPDDGISQECFVAIQLQVAEVPADDRSLIPDEELDEVCPGWVRFSVPATTP